MPILLYFTLLYLPICRDREISLIIGPVIFICYKHFNAQNAKTRKKVQSYGHADGCQVTIYTQLDFWPFGLTISAYLRPAMDHIFTDFSVYRWSQLFLLATYTHIRRHTHRESQTQLVTLLTPAVISSVISACAELSWAKPCSFYLVTLNFDLWPWSSALT